MKVYVLEKGEYSDQQTIGVFTTLEAAQGAIRSAEWREADWADGTGWWGAEAGARYSDLLTVAEFDLDDRDEARRRAEAMGY